MSKFTRLIAGAAAAACIAATAAAQDKPDAATVLATVNGTEITLGHVAALAGRLPPEYAQMPAKDLYDGILEQLIQQTALMQKIEDDPGREAKLSLENQTRAFLASVLVDRLAEAPLEEGAVEALYKERYAEFDPETEAHAAHILVETEDEAKEIAGLLAEGTDFAELARERSTGPSGPGGGDLGWLTHGEVVKPFGDALFALEPGDISEPVETQFGWHVIKLNDTRLTKAPPLDEVRGEIERQIRDAALTAAVEEITAAADVTRSEVEIDPAIIRDVTLLGE